MRLGVHLVCLGMLPEADLYAALSLQNNLPLGPPEKDLVSVRPRDVQFSRSDPKRPNAPLPDG